MSEKFKQIKVNFYPSQHAFLKEEAKSNNMTIAQYIRTKLDLSLEEKDTRKEYKKHDEIIHKKADPKLIYELSKIGNNLNQIAKYLNTHKTDEKIDLLQALINIEQQIKELN